MVGDHHFGILHGHVVSVGHGLTPTEAVAVPHRVVHDEVGRGEDVEQPLWAALRHVPQEPTPRLFQAMVSQPRLRETNGSHMS